jgi:hypothetical protein
MCGQLPIYSSSFTASFVIENVLHLTLNFVPRFPNPVPALIRVPHLVVLDVSVCLKTFSKRHHNNNTVQTMTIGTSMKRMPLVVRIVSLCSLSSRRCRLPPKFQLDSPEFGPGAIIDATGMSISGSD